MIHILGVKLGCFSVRGVSVREKAGKIMRSLCQDV